MTCDIDFGCTRCNTTFAQADLVRAHFMDDFCTLECPSCGHDEFNLYVSVQE